MKMIFLLLQKIYKYSSAIFITFMIPMLISYSLLLQTIDMIAFYMENNTNGRKYYFVCV